MECRARVNSYKKRATKVLNKGNYTDGDTGSALKRESLEKEIDSCWWGGGVGVEPKPTAHGLGEGREVRHLTEIDWPVVGGGGSVWTIEQSDG